MRTAPQLDTQLVAPPPTEQRPAILLTTGLVDHENLSAESILLRPGDWLFGRGAVRCSTLLGSSVALILWVPRLQFGAVLHCLIPARPVELRKSEELDGRFGEEAALWLDQHFATAGCLWSEAQATLVGGASACTSSTGADNIVWARGWATQRGLNFVQQDVGGRVVRRLAFNLRNGNLTITHGGLLRAL